MSEVAQGRRRRPASWCRCPAWPGPTPDRGRGPRRGPERCKACNCGTCRYLVVLADAGTFHRAADRLFIAQPTLSQQIRRLEEIVGTPLQRRRRDRLQLTPGRCRPGLTTSPETLPAALEAMVTGEFEPEVWIPAADDGAISLAELVSLPVIHGPRRAEPVTYDAWTTLMQTVNPRFAFTDPPLRCPLPVTLAFAATADRPTAVLTCPATAAGGPPGSARRPGPAGASGMVPGQPPAPPADRRGGPRLARRPALGTVSPAKVHSGCPKETLPLGGPDAASWSLALALAAGIVDSIGCQSQSRMKAEWTLAG